MFRPETLGPAEGCSGCGQGGVTGRPSAFPGHLLPQAGRQQSTGTGAQVRAPPLQRGHLGSSLPLSTHVGMQATPPPSCTPVFGVGSEQGCRLLPPARVEHPFQSDADDVPLPHPPPQGEGQGPRILPGNRRLVPKHSKFLLLPAGPEARLGRGAGRGPRCPPARPRAREAGYALRGRGAGAPGRPFWGERKARCGRPHGSVGPESRPRTRGPQRPGGGAGGRLPRLSQRKGAPWGAGRPAGPRFLPRSRPLGSGAGDEGRDRRGGGWRGAGGRPPPRGLSFLLRVWQEPDPTPPGLPRRRLSLPPTPRPPRVRIPPAASRSDGGRPLPRRLSPAPARGRPGSRPPGARRELGFPEPGVCAGRLWRGGGKGAGSAPCPRHPASRAPLALPVSARGRGAGAGGPRAEPPRAGRGRVYVSGARAGRRPPAAEAGTAAAARTGPERALGPRPGDGQPDGDRASHFLRSAPRRRLSAGGKAPLPPGLCPFPGLRRGPRSCPPHPSDPNPGPESLQGDAPPGPRFPPPATPTPSVAWPKSWGRCQGPG